MKGDMVITGFENHSIMNNCMSSINKGFLVTSSESEKLMAEFSEKEVREAIFQMKHNKAPGPDGFLAEFYQVFWSLIKDDLMAMF
jgi:hypothetical protein